jgi:hypothetical protein
MKFFRGLFPGLAASVALVCTAAAANAQMLAPYDAGKARPVSDVDGPYSSGPPPIEVPPPAPRYYGYGPDRGGYAPDRGYAPDYRYESNRDYDRGYGPDRGYAPERGYGPDQGYAPGPALLPPQEVYAILRENGFSPLGIPRQRGYVYVIAVLDRGGEDGRLTIDGRNGRIIRFVPASQWGQAYDRMSFGRGPDLAPRAAGALPPTTRVNAAPPPVIYAAPSVASRAATVPVPAQRPAAVATKPAQPSPAQQAAVNNEAKPVAAPPPAASTAGEAKPAAPQVKPTQGMPAVQGLE